MLNFRDSSNSFKLDGDFLKTMTSHNFKVGLFIQHDQKLKNEFGTEMNFYMKNIGGKSDRDRSLAQLLRSPAIMASGFSAMFLTENFNELCERLKLLLQEKQTGNNSNITNEEIVAIADKLLKYKWTSNEQHRFFTTKILN